MKLEDIVKNDKVIDLQTLKADQELVTEIQTQLSRLLLYSSSNVDGLYGQVTEGALILFCDDLHLDNMQIGKFGEGRILLFPVRLGVSGRLWFWLRRCFWCCVR